MYNSVLDQPTLNVIIITSSEFIPTLDIFSVLHCYNSAFIFFLSINFSFGFMFHHVTFDIHNTSEKPRLQAESKIWQCCCVIRLWTPGAFFMPTVGINSLTLNTTIRKKLSQSGTLAVYRLKEVPLGNLGNPSVSGSPYGALQRNSVALGRSSILHQHVFTCLHMISEDPHLVPITQTHSAVNNFSHRCSFPSGGAHRLSKRSACYIKWPLNLSAEHRRTSRSLSEGKKNCSPCGSARRSPLFAEEYWLDHTG